MKRRAMLGVVLLVALSIGGCLGPRVPPVAQFTDCPDGWRGGLDVQFVSTSTTAAGHWIARTSWSFGDGATEENGSGWTSHAYAEPGYYVVRLTVTDNRGIASSVERTVHVVRVVEIHDVDLSTGFPTRVTGTIENASTRLLHSAVVKIKFYDREGIRVAETAVDVMSVDPGERVRFLAEAPVGVGEVTSIRASVTSFVADCGPWVFPMPVASSPSVSP